MQPPFSFWRLTSIHTLLFLAPMGGDVLLKGQARLLGSHSSLVTGSVQSIVFFLRRCSHPSTQFSHRFGEF
jgi:hypothetical protein